MDEPLVRLESADGVARIVLDSPHNRNALSRRLLADLEGAVDAATTDQAARVIVLTGGGTVFCSGADLKEQRAANEAGAEAGVNALPGILTKLWDCPKPVICRLNGPARAGGTGLLASCDIVVAPQEVTFSFTEVRLGLVPAIITVPLLRRVQPQALHRLFLTGEVFSAEQARDIGLVDIVAGSGELDAEVSRVAEMLGRGGPEALALTKQLVPKIRAMSTSDAFAYLTELSAERFASTEGLEGMQSFAEKRDPSWVRKG